MLKRQVVQELIAIRLKVRRSISAVDEYLNRWRFTRYLRGLSSVPMSNIPLQFFSGSAVTTLVMPPVATRNRPDFVRAMRRGSTMTTNRDLAMRPEVKFQ